MTSASKIEGISAKTLAKYFGYLDQLRDSGITNMFGASPYLSTAFGMKRDKAASVLSAWMKTFSNEETPKQRAEKAIAA